MSSPLEPLFFIANVKITFLIVLSFCITTSAIVVSNKKSDDVRLIFLSGLTIIVFMLAFSSDIVFGILDENHYYKNYFLNLSVELLAALIVFPLIINAWLEEKIRMSLSLSIIFGLIGWWLITPNLVDFRAILPPFVNAYIFDEIKVNLGYEVLSAVAISMILSLLLSVYLTFKDSVWNLIYSGLALLLVSLGLIYFSLNVQIQYDLSIAIVGAIFTFVVISSWIIDSPRLFIAVAFATLILSTIVLINVEVRLLYNIPIDESMAFDISAELIGALVAGILINRKWLWNKTH